MPTPLETAEAAYAAAERMLTTDAWKRAARALYKVRRKARIAPRGKGRGRYPPAVAEATFADGKIISMTFWSQAGKPLDWARAIRVCTSAYRLEHGLPYRRFPLEGNFFTEKTEAERRALEATYDAMQETDRRIHERLPLANVPAIVRMRDKTTEEVWVAS